MNCEQQQADSLIKLTVDIIEWMGSRLSRERRTASLRPPNWRGDRSECVVAQPVR